MARTKKAKTPRTGTAQKERSSQSDASAVKGESAGDLTPADSMSGATEEPVKFASSPCSLADFIEESERGIKIYLRRAYESPSSEDGERFLVDRLWPRGIKKDDLLITAWLKDVAPSNDLRRWFGHDPERWNEFCKRYRKELQSLPQVLEPLLQALDLGPITLIYSARDESHNQAVVLRDVLLETKKWG